MAIRIDNPIAQPADLVGDATETMIHVLIRSTARREVPVEIRFRTEHSQATVAADAQVVNVPRSEGFTSPGELRFAQKVKVIVDPVVRPIHMKIVLAARETDNPAAGVIECPIDVNVL